MRITDTEVRQQLGRIVNQRRAIGFDLTDDEIGQLEPQALDQLIDQELMNQAAEEAGYVVTDDELRWSIRNDPQFFGPEGRFTAESYRNTFRGDERRMQRYESDLRERLLRARIGALIRGSVRVTDAELRDAYRRDNVEVDVEYVRLSIADFEDQIDLSEEAIAAWLAENEDQARREYDENRETRYTQTEQVRASHILMRTSEDDPEELQAEVRSRMEAALQRARAGEDFAALARELSEDSSARRGGDLGMFDAQAMVAPFSEAAFALEVDGISDLVETRFGLHIIKVLERQEAGETPFEEVREDIARGLMADAEAPDLARGVAQEVADAFAAGESPAELLAANDLSADTTGPFRPSEGRVPGLGNSPELLGAAAALGTPGAGPGQVFEVPGGFAAIRLVSREEADMAGFFEERDELLDRARLERELDAVDAWTDLLRSNAEIRVAVR